MVIKGIHDYIEDDGYEDGDVNIESDGDNEDDEIDKNDDNEY